MKTPLIAMLLLSAMLAPASCKYRGRPDLRETLRMQLPAEPDTLNPITATDAYSSTINGHIYETLLERNNDTLDLEPCLAERWKISPDKTRFRFYLKKDVLWSDGKPFTADDVVYSYRTIMDPRTACASLKVYVKDIKSCVIIDKYTVEFTYASPFFLALEYCGTMPVVPKHIFDDGSNFNEHVNNRKPVGTGPYRFSVWNTAEKIELVRNERYRGDKPEISRIVYRIVPEPSVALQMLKKGDLDVMGLRDIQWARQTGSERFQSMFYKLKYYRPNYSYIGWNSRRDMFSDKRVRRAMTHLINRKDILGKLLFGNGEIVTGNFYIFSRYYDRSIEPWPYDEKKARLLLGEAGWRDSDGDGILDKNGRKFSFTFTISSGSKFSERLATILKEDFQRSGIEMNINRYEWAVFIQKIQKKDFDATTLAWSLGYSSDPYQLWHSSQIASGSNYCSFSNREADRIIEAARKEFNDSKREKMYRRFHEILHEEQPYTFLFCTPALSAVSRRFDNVKVHTTGLEIREWRIAE